MSHFLGYSFSTFSHYLIQIMTEVYSVESKLPEDGQWVCHCFAGVHDWIFGVFNKGETSDFDRFNIGSGPYSEPATHWFIPPMPPEPTHSYNEDDEFVFSLDELSFH